MSHVPTDKEVMLLNHIRESIQEVVADAVQATKAVSVTLSPEVADALCCYLDDEDVFPEVVDALLKAIPVEQPPPLPADYIDPKFFTPANTGRFQMEHGTDTFYEFTQRNPSIIRNKTVVFRIVEDPNKKYRMEGYNLYNEHLGRYWFSEHTPSYGWKEIGYWHPHSGMYMRTNEQMIDYLIKKEYIKTTGEGA